MEKKEPNITPRFKKGDAFVGMAPHPLVFMEVNEVEGNAGNKDFCIVTWYSLDEKGINAQRRFPMVAVEGEFCNFKPISRNLLKEAKSLMRQFDVKVSQSYANENGGKVGGDIVENVVEKDLNDVEKTSDVAENVVENIVETTQKTTQKIIELIRNYPEITKEELAEKCGVTSDGIKWQLKKLKSQGVIRRIGPDKGGRWEIIAP